MAILLRLLIVLCCVAASAAAQVGDEAVRAIWGSADSYKTDETDLTKAHYTFEESGSSSDVLVNWSNGMMVFKGIARSEDLMDEEGLKMEARDYAYVKAREFLNGVIVGREDEIEKRGLRQVAGGSFDEKNAIMNKWKISISVPPELVRTGPILSETFRQEEHPAKRNSSIAISEVSIALLLYNKEHPNEGILARMLPTLRDEYKKIGIKQAERPPEGAVQALKATEPELATHTGLVVDTRGYFMRPVASPQVFIEGQEGRQVYGVLAVDPKYVSQIGIAGWAKSPETVSADRVGSKPLLVKACGTMGSASGTVLLKPVDAARVMAADTIRPFLQECRVVFVVD